MGHERRADMINVSQTLSTMEFGYTMPEERLNHSPNLSGRQPVQTTKTGDELTFF